MHCLISHAPTASERIDLLTAHFASIRITKKANNYKNKQKIYGHTNVSLRKNLRDSLANVALALSNLIALKDTLASNDNEKNKRHFISEKDFFIENYNHFIQYSKNFWGFQEQTYLRENLLQESAFLRIQSEPPLQETSLLPPAVAKKAELHHHSINKQLNDDSDLLTPMYKKSTCYQDNLFLDYSAMKLKNYLLTNKKNNINKNNNNICSEDHKITTRIGTEEARYRTQFNALDDLVTRLQDLNNRLTEYLRPDPKQSEER